MSGQSGDRSRTGTGEGCEIAHPPVVGELDGGAWGSRASVLERGSPHSPLPTSWRGQSANPKGIAASSPGLAPGAYPGYGRAKRGNPNGVVSGRLRQGHNPVGVDTHSHRVSQGSACRATLGFGPESLWDSSSRSRGVVGNTQSHLPHSNAGVRLEPPLDQPRHRQPGDALGGKFQLPSPQVRPSELRFLACRFSALG